MLSDPPRHADDAPQLRLVELKKAGVFDGDHPKAVELSDGLTKANVRYIGPDRLEVVLNDRSHQIDVASVQLKHGPRRFFVCPRSGERCASLFVVGGELLGRRAARLTYASQSMSKAERDDHRIATTVTQLGGERPARGKRRLRLLEKLRQEPADRLGLDALAELDREDERRRNDRYRRRRPSRSESPLTTRSALLAGRRGPPILSSEKVLQYLYDRVALTYPTLPPSGLGRSTGLGASCSDHAQLDVRELQPKRGLASGHALTWTYPDRSRLLGLAHLRAKDDGSETLVIELSQGDLNVRQELQVVGGQRRGDRFLVCPVIGTRHVRLFFRDGRFACRWAQKLI